MRQRLKALDLRQTYAYIESMSLTPKQKAFLDYLTQFRTENGFAPSQNEIAEHFGFRSLGTVQKYLVRLKEKGLLESTPHAKRGLAVKPRKPAAALGVSLPLLGRVAAGRPIEAIEARDEMNEIEVPVSLIKRGEHFVLQVVGNSMVEDGILDGDFVIVKKQKTAERGQMVIALVDDSATVKRFYPKKGMIELHPANPEYQPIVVQPDQSFQIEGIVAGVVRKVV